MLDIGWTELIVIGLLALLVVGPKELPRLLRTVGRFVGQARSMARDFQRSMEDAAREADLTELTDLRRDLEKAGRVSFEDQAKRSSSSLSSAGKNPAGAKAAEAEPGGSRPARAPGSRPEEPAAKAPAKAETPPEPAEPASPPERKAASGER